MPETSPETAQLESPRVRRHQKAAALLRKWMAQADGYDERTWPALEQELKDSAVRCREGEEPPA
jgi:hypothetical protein